MRWGRIVAVTAAAFTLLGAGALLTPQREKPAAPVRTVSQVERWQELLRTTPGNWQAWNALGMSYVEQARQTGDPLLYPKAQGAFEESLRHKHNDGALAGLGALANARHDFTAARKLAEEALALNDHSAHALGVLVDAQTQLGEAAAATQSVQRMLDVNPDLPALTRAAYDLELHGKVERARELLQQALDATVDATATAYLRQLLGDLAWGIGDLATAKREYTGHQLGEARIAASEKDHDRAIRLMAEVTARTPTPDHLLEYAEILRNAGRLSEAEAQLGLADAALKLLADAGGADDLTAAQLAIAQGDPSRAVTLAQREWQRRKHTDVADTLAWALHLAGRHQDALHYARIANALGSRSAVYAYHWRTIEGAAK